MTADRPTIDPRRPFYFLAQATERGKPDLIDFADETVKASQEDGAVETLTALAQAEAREYKGGRYFLFEAIPVKRITRKTVELLPGWDSLSFAVTGIIKRRKRKGSRRGRPSEGTWKKRHGKEWLHLKRVYYRDPERVYMALALTHVDVRRATVEGWKNRQRREAAEWAISTHLSASDNEDVGVPPMPEFLKEAHRRDNAAP